MTDVGHEDLFAYLTGMIQFWSDAIADSSFTALLTRANNDIFLDTPLHLAVRGGYPRIVNLLFVHLPASAGAKVVYISTKNAAGDNAYDLARRLPDGEDKAEIVKILEDLLRQAGGEVWDDLNRR